MNTVFIEVEHDFNWGKFIIGRFDGEEWSRMSNVDSAVKASLLRQRGWTPDHIWVMDIETGEGAYFLPGGVASCDLRKHKIWVCPMFEHFLTWLYKQDLTDLNTLPRLVKLTSKDVPGEMYGYRREGPGEEAEESLKNRTCKKRKKGA